MARGIFVRCLQIVAWYQSPRACAHTHCTCFKPSRTISGAAGGDTEWIEIQKKTFTNWANVRLEEKGFTKLTKIEEEFKTGVHLIEMVMNNIAS